MSEIWKDVLGYEGIYQVSNLGNVRSLDRIIKTKNGVCKNTKGTLLSAHRGKGHYKSVDLSKGDKRKTIAVHSLVCITFYGPRNGMCVNHINKNPFDNRLENLEYITNRENVSHIKKKTSSKYTGVYWVKKDARWRADIRVNKKYIYLGYFQNEEDAAKAYADALKAHGLTNKYAVKR